MNMKVNNNKIKVIMFDFDDTLAYTSLVSKEKFKNIYFEYYPNNTEKDFLEYRKKVKWLPFSTKLKWISEVDIDLLKKRWFLDYRDNFGKCVLFDWWIELFESIKKQNIKLYIVSNKFKELLYEMLKYFSIEKYFDVIIWEDTFDFYKPDVRLSQEICKKYNLYPKDVLYIWNSEVDREFYTKSGFYGFVSEENNKRLSFVKDFIK